MRLTLDTDDRTCRLQSAGKESLCDLYSKEAFELLTKQWLKTGWNLKYTYCFTWLGRPIIQLPEDLVRVQEVIYSVQPDVIVETGTAHGGSAVFYASLCRLVGRGRVISVDVEIRAHNRRYIESHALSSSITLIEGDSANAATFDKVRRLVGAKESVLVILDSCHTKEHVGKELELYHTLVTPGSYIVAADGIMEILNDVPQGKSGWKADNPAAATLEFAANHPEFVLEQPRWPFCENNLDQNITYWPKAWLRRRPCSTGKAGQVEAAAVHP